MFVTVTFTVTLRDKALKTIININTTIVFWFVHLQLLLLIAFIVSVAAEGLLFTYDRRGLWMHFTAEDNKTAVKTSLQLPCEAVEIFQRYIEPYR